MATLAQIQQLYITYFGRPADADGLSYYANATTAQISAAFGGSPEYTATLARVSVVDIVTLTYQNLFGRVPSSSELTVWASLVNAPFSAVNLANLPSFIAGGAQVKDATTFNNKVAAATSFTASLTTASQMSAYTNADAAAIARAFIATVTDNASLATATSAANLQAVSQSMVATKATLALTTSTDTLAPTTAQPLNGNDTFNATSVGDVQTLSGSDSLDGGAGTDTLNITSTSLLPFSIPGTVSVKNIENIALTAASNVTADISGWTGVSQWTTTMAAGTGLNLTAKDVSGSITLGSGNDTLVYTGTVPPLLDGGAGTDTLSLAASTVAALNEVHNVKNFERLVLTGAAAQTVDLGALGGAASGITTVATSGGTGLTLNSFAVGNTLQLTGAGTAYTLGNAAFATGSNDSVKLLLSDGSGTAVNFASTGITATGVETINITTQDNQTKASGSFSDAVTLLGNSVQTITVAGNAGLSIKAASSSLTSLDASAMTLGGVALVSGSTPISLSVKGSTVGTNTIDVSAGFNNASLGGSTVSVDNANYIIKGGLGSDTITVGTGTNSVTLGTSGQDRVNVKVTANAGTYTTITDARAAMSIGFADKGSETMMKNMVQVVSTGGGYVPPGGTAAQSSLKDYADAVIAAAGDASVNGVFGWVQYNGDTYLVESRHNGVTVSTFVDGTDLIVKFTGLVDLGKLILDGGANTLTLSY